MPAIGGLARGGRRDQGGAQGRVYDGVEESPQPSASGCLTEHVTGVSGRCD